MRFKAGGFELHFHCESFPAVYTYNDQRIDKPEISCDGSCSLDIWYTYKQYRKVHVYINAYTIFPLVYLTRHSLQTAVSGFEFFILRPLIIIHYILHLRASRTHLRIKSHRMVM